MHRRVNPAKSPKWHNHTTHMSNNNKSRHQQKQTSPVEMALEVVCGQVPCIKLVREDLFEDPTSDLGTIENPFEQDIEFSACPTSREDLLQAYGLPSDAVVKLNFEGKFIPWSMVPYCSTKGSVRIHIFRPHQTVKPRLQGEDAVTGASEPLVREKIRQLENRVASLESSMDETVLQTKTERDLQLLTKQIAFLSNRLEEADRAEWIKKE